MDKIDFSNNVLKYELKVQPSCESKGVDKMTAEEARQKYTRFETHGEYVMWWK